MTTTPELSSVERGEMKMELPSVEAKASHQESSMAEQSSRYVAPPELERIAEAIERAQCPNREGPYGLYDYTSYGHPKPHHVRDFRDPRSDTWGHAVLMTTSREEAEATYRRLTRAHVARAAVEAVAASSVSDEQPPAEDRPSGLSGDSHASAVAKPDALPLPSSPNKVEDLIGRLLREAAFSEEMGPDNTDAVAMREAATLLQDQQSEISRLKEEREEAKAFGDDMLKIGMKSCSEALARAEAAEAERDRAYARTDVYIEKLKEADTHATAAESQVASLKAALEPFRSGGGWGKFLAWLVNGAPTREVGIAASKQIVSWRNAVDAALSNTAADKGDGHE